MVLAKGFKTSNSRVKDSNSIAFIIRERDNHTRSFDNSCLPELCFLESKDRQSPPVQALNDLTSSHPVPSTRLTFPRKLCKLYFELCHIF